MADVREKREVINTEREREREREREISFQKNYNDLDRMVIGFTKQMYNYYCIQCPSPLCL